MPSAVSAQSVATAEEQAAFERKAEARRKLAAALSRIASDGRNGFALLDAGEAALSLNDPQAALGFLARAQAFLPDEGRVRSALGATMVGLDRPADAIRYFGEAQSMGVREERYLGERALARDLSGDNSGAQRDYRAALAREPGNRDLVRDLAISQGIGGDMDGAIATLSPLLAQQDRAAWRARAFILAMNGREKDAGDTVDAVMPANFASRIKPYLAQMDRLTPEQKAAAAHLGRFPSGTLGNSPVQLASAETPVPREPNRAERRAARRAARDAERSGSGAARSAGRQRTVAVPPPGAAVTRNTPAKTMPPATNEQAPAAVTVIERQPPQPQPRPAVIGPPAVEPEPAPGFGAVNIGSEAAEDSPASSSGSSGFGEVRRITVGPQPLPEPRRSLMDIVAEIDVPDAPSQQSSALGEIELERIRREQLAAQEAADLLETERKARERSAAQERAREAAERAERNANPARHWVQVATGADVSALAFDYRRLARRYSEQFEGLSGYTSAWGRTSRLVVGPFDSQAEAKAWEAKYRRAGGDGFVWTSTDGLEVEKIGGK